MTTPQAFDETDRLQAGGAHHRAGRFDAARRCYEDVLARNPENSSALHLLGFLHAFQGRTDEGVALLRRAVELVPRFPEALNHLGLALKRQGKRDEATDCFRRALAIVPDFAEARLNLGNILSEQGRLDAAIAAFREVLAIAPAMPLAHNNLGSALFESGKQQEAVACFRRAIELDGDYAEAHKNLATVLVELEQATEAVATFRRALAADPGYAEAHYGLGNALFRQGHYEEAIACFRRAVALDARHADAHVKLGIALARRNSDPANAPSLHAEAERHFAEAVALASKAVDSAPDDWRSWQILGHARMRQGRVEDALAARHKRTAILRRPGTSRFSDMGSYRHTTVGKLDHDLEQVEYLVANGRLGAEGPALVNAYRAAHARLPESTSATQLLEIGDDMRRSIGDTYNRLWHIAPAHELPGPAVSPALDRAAIEADYAGRRPGITWLDGLLTAEALESLRRYCLESTIWFTYIYKNGYLGAFAEDGFDCPLLVQIGRELPQRLPGIFGDHKLLQVWAFKYGAKPDGIAMHADFAAINVNFWITPDDANLDPDGGGLVVWDKEAPADWDFQTYNNDEDALRRFIAESGAKPHVVPHRQNRAVIFNSDLIHRTDTIRFREGYENRRINVTFLYGERGGRV